MCTDEMSFPCAGAETVRRLWTKLFALAASVVAGKPWESRAAACAVTSLQFSHERQEMGPWLSQGSREHRQCLSSLSSLNIAEPCPFYCSWGFDVVL